MVREFEPALRTTPFGSETTPLVFAEITFAGCAPALSRIAGKVTELSGLDLLIQEVEPDNQGNLYDIRARLEARVSGH